MRDAHFERFRPRCVECAAAGRDPSVLELAHVERRVDDDILEGSLACPVATCRVEYPIIDGIPVIAPNVRGVVANQYANFVAPAELSPWTESLLLDCTGPGGELDRRQYGLSSYAHSHWGDLAPDDPAPPEASLGRLLADALAVAPAPPRGAWVDLGCSVGRATFELAAATGDLALGLDLNVASLRMARRIVREGRAVYPVRKGGIVYGRRDFAVEPAARARVDFWACDATALPLADASVDGALSLNVVDCVPAPLNHLIEAGRVLRDGAPLVLTTPYDWSPNATALEGWLGGHSARSVQGGSSVAELRRILSADDAARAGTGLAIVAERDDLPWQVYVHARASMHYRVHAAVAVRAER